jgi:pimeloyl-ACP methyl ester carboxylesterase
MGIYDVPTMLDYIAKMTNQKIYYIGHSMGTTVSFIYASLFPEKAKRNLKSIVSLAPIAYMGNVTSVVKAFVPLRNDIWVSLFSYIVLTKSFIELVLLSQLTFLKANYSFLKI